jgi:hypothetical protein
MGGRARGTSVWRLFVLENRLHEVAFRAPRRACESSGPPPARRTRALGAYRLGRGARNAGLAVLREGTDEKYASSRDGGDRRRRVGVRGLALSGGTRGNSIAPAVASVRVPVASNGRGCPWRHGEGHDRGRGGPRARRRRISSSHRCFIGSPSHWIGHLPACASRSEWAHEIPCVGGEITRSARPARGQKRDAAARIAEGPTGRRRHYRQRRRGR